MTSSWIRDFSRRSFLKMRELNTPSTHRNTLMRSDIIYDCLGRLCKSHAYSDIAKLARSKRSSVNKMKTNSLKAKYTFGFWNCSIVSMLCY